MTCSVCSLSHKMVDRALKEIKENDNKLLCSCPRKQLISYILLNF